MCFVTGGSADDGVLSHHSLLCLGSLVTPCLQVPCSFWSHFSMVLTESLSTSCSLDRPWVIISTMSVICGCPPLAEVSFSGQCFCSLRANGNGTLQFLTHMLRRNFSIKMGDYFQTFTSYEMVFSSTYFFLCILFFCSDCSVLLLSDVLGCLNGICTCMCACVLCV